MLGSLASWQNFLLFQAIARRALLGANPMSRADEPERTERLRIFVSTEELAGIDEFRFENRMATKAAAVRELLRRGLAAVKKEHWPPLE